jgi:hypothetical protein
MTTPCSMMPWMKVRSISVGTGLPSDGSRQSSHPLAAGAGHWLMLCPIRDNGQSRAGIRGAAGHRGFRMSEGRLLAA